MASSSKGKAKRKRIVLSVGDKLKICEMLRKKIPKSEIMLKYNIGKSTVNNFKMSKCELGTAKCVKATKSMKGGMFDKLDNALYLWFRQQRENGIPITGPILLEKASEFHSIYTESPKPLWRFCNRFGIKSLAITGEKLSAVHVSADEFVKSFGELTAGYTLDQIFYCDETGLYYKMLPGHTLTTTHNDPSGAKKAKERMTINACSNGTGSIKLPLLFIGKAKNPRCFRMIDQATLPVVYRNQRNAWVDTIIFNGWCQNCFAPDVKKMLTELGLEPRAVRTNLFPRMGKSLPNFSHQTSHHSSNQWIREDWSA